MRFDDGAVIGAFAGGNNNPPALWWWGFAIVGVMTGIWFVLTLWLFRRLRKRHAATYEAIGSPSLIWNNSLRSNWLFLKFLYSPRPLELDDAPAAKVAGVLRIVLPTHYVVFFVLLILMLVMMFA